MPNAIIHYAIGVAIAHAAGYRGRAAWLLGAFGALPDIDVLTAVLNLGILAIADPSDSAIRTLSLALGHRGLSHSLLLTAVAGVIALAATRKPRFAAVATLAYLAHLVADFLTPWPVYPLLPWQPWQGELGILAIWDPVFTSLALLYLAFAFAAERSAGRLAWPARVPGWLARRDAGAWWRGARATALAFLVLLAGAAAAKAAIASATGASYADVEAIHLLQYTYVVREGDTYHVGVTPFIGSPGQTLTVPVITLGENTTEADATLVYDAAKRMECTVLYDWYTKPLWTVQRANETVVVEVRAAKAAATSLGEAGFGLRFLYLDGQYAQATLLEGGREDTLFREEITALARCA